MAKTEDAATVDALKVELDALREEFTSMLGKMSDKAHATADDASAELRARLAGLTEDDRDAAYRVRDKGEEYVSDAQDVIARNPLIAVGGALALGVVIGLMSRR